MKSKILIALFLTALVFAPGFAQMAGGGSGEPEDWQGEPMVAPQKFGNLEVDTSTEKGQQIAQIMEQQQERLQVTTATRTQQQSMNTHGYRVSNCAQSLADAAGMMGGVGSQVSEAARSVNESSRNMMRYEERLQSQNMFMKFLFGSDQDVVKAAEQQMNQTRERIRELERLQSQVNDPQVKAMFQEQIRLMNQEITQTQTMLQNEKKSRGIFGFLFGS